MRLFRKREPQPEVVPCPECGSAKTGIDFLIASDPPRRFWSCAECKRKWEDLGAPLWKRRGFLWFLRRRPRRFSKEVLRKMLNGLGRV